MTQKTKNTEAQICPFLGLPDDPNSHMAFTSPLNSCHGSKSSPVPVKFDHQNSHCLVPNFADCQVFLAGHKKSFPRDLHNRAKKDAYPRERRSRVPAFLVIALILLSAGYWLFGGGTLAFPAAPPFPSATTTEAATQALNIASPSSVGSETATLDPNTTATVTPFPTLTLTPTPSFTPTNTPTQTRSPSITPTIFTLTPTATPSSYHTLDVPIGNVQKFLIHRLIGGENLTALASQHKTSIEVILAVNYTLSVPVLEGSLIVIPIEMDNPAVLPVFEIHQVLDQEISIENLATVLDTDPVLFKYFNNFENGELLYQGDWALVPRGRDENQ